ncbi:putative type-1 restriction enzyme specificity protein [Clostridium acetireducens DSM 10703]|uniref:Putative type-1 restriction enzyme specificity protein n=1 Tax=Clostridium acetireducens DSM 10703 TaxID=1121290 RepID=A0A1E8F1J3_9CLOT|nr:restriction endonuclease subunit S [Clostridium acetireducens]OFI07480.1 putative type-1 restriction enzyme specificity protein [Clostridium acetireducens DSM 10703]
MSFKYTEIGKIPVEWDVKMIQEIGEVVSGGTPKTKEDSYWDGNISWITPKDLSSFTERYIEVGERSITELGLKNSSAKLLPKGTVLFSSRAPIGYLAIARKELCTNQGFKNIICDKKYSSNEFLFYMLKAKKNEIESIAGGSTFKEVSGKVVKEFKIPIPPLNEQKAIAHILSTLDDKIEVNNQINKTLENMAQAIFKQWFVDFEFPNEDGEPYKSSGGEMVESELGMIPRGWEVGVLGDIISISSGKRPKKKSKEPYEEFVIPLIGASSTMGYVKEYNYFEPIIIIGRVGTHGVVQRFKDKVWASDNTLVIKSEYYEYVHQLLGLIDYASLNRGSTQPLITQTDIKNVRILIPYKSILNQYEELVGKLYELVNSRLDENSNLINLRDTLLPKLMSGEIRVPLDEEGEVS